jgi:hypothetical protein
MCSHIVRLGFFCCCSQTNASTRTAPFSALQKDYKPFRNEPVEISSSRYARNPSRGPGIEHRRLSSTLLKTTMGGHQPAARRPRRLPRARDPTGWSESEKPKSPMRPESAQVNLHSEDSFGWAPIPFHQDQSCKMIPAIDGRHNPN